MVGMVVRVLIPVKEGPQNGQIGIQLLSIDGIKDFFFSFAKHPSVEIKER